MGYKIVIPVITIVAVLLTSGITLQESFATHEFERGKAAYMFDCSGVNGGNINFHPQVKQFFEKNNGSYHPCGYNWMYQAINATGNNWGYHQNDLGQAGAGVGGPCTDQTRCHNGVPVTHFALSNPFGWNKFIDQYQSSTTNSKMPELANSKNTKLILRGYSWGGGAATMLATEVNRDIDLVFLIDAVGLTCSKATLVKVCGTDELWIPPPLLLLSCTIIGADRVFHARVTQVIQHFQKEAPFPFDFLTGGFADPNDNYEEHVFDCENPENQATDPNCHSTIEGQISIFNDFKEELQSMNSEPFFQPGILPTEIILNEGDVDSWPIHTPDFKTKSEELHQMDMTFRDLTTSDSMKFDIDIDQGFLDNINNNNNRLRVGSFDLNTYDNFTTNIILQVEDNGFPCGDCIGDPNAMGAKGYWDRESIPVTVHNVPPTIENFETLMAGFNAIMLLDTSDPSIRDEEAGFDYTIDWGDGPPETVHGEVLAQIRHEYTNSGKYTITVFATDKDGDSSGSESDTVYTPFVKLLDDFDDLVTDGTLNNGQGNSFKSKLNAIIKDIDKGYLIPACNVAEALINEVEAFVKSGKLTEQQRDELIEEIEKSKDQIGCNGSIIVVEKQTSPADHPAQWTFTGDATGAIGDNGQIQVNVSPGQYTSTEALPWPDGWELQNIICTDDNSSGSFSTATFNVEEDEYVVCIFINADFDLSEEQLSQTFDGRGGSSKSDLANAQARFNTFGSQTSDDITDDKKGGGGDEHLTRPTFGVSHETFETIVDSGFRFNDQSFTINDNFHTPFAQQTVNIGEVNSFEAKIYADKRIKVQEFLFGIPNVGEAHLAELGVEVWYDYNGEIEEVKAIQKSNVIDKETIVATHEKAKCQATDSEEKCDVTNVSVVFLEPLKDKIMAVKAIDYKGRYQITYLNEGVEIAGESLNPMQTYLIPSNIRDQGLIKVTQLAKYSPYWQSDDDRMFEMNSFGSFKEINITFERFQDTGTAYTRLHSGFGGVMAYELKRATGIFDASELISELPDFISYSPPEISERMTAEMKQKMLEQEEIAKKIIEESKVQARW